MRSCLAQASIDSPLASAGFLRGQAAIERASPSARILRGQAAIECCSGSTARPLRAQAAIDCSSSTAGGSRGQAAMEYLVTYGWALLALFVVIALLISSGAFSSGSYAVQECTVQPDLPCPSFVLYRQEGGAPATTLQFSLANGLGFPINITGVAYTANGLGNPDRTTYSGGLPAPQGIIKSGQRMNFTQSFPGAFQPQIRDFRTIYVSLTYSNCKRIPCSGSYTTTGRISTVVEKG